MPPQINENISLTKGQLFNLVSCSFILVFFSAENLLHYPYTLISIIGCVMLFNDYMEGKLWHYKLFFLIFFSIWIPMLLSTLGSVNKERSISTTLLYLHFLPSTYFMIKVSMSSRFRKIFSYLLFIFFIFLVIDSFVQFFRGINLFGQELIDGKITSIFYPKQRPAIILVLICPIIISFVSDLHSHRFKYLMGSALLFAFVIILILSFKRSAWLMFLYLIFLMGIFNFRSICFRGFFKYVLPLIALVASIFLIFETNSNLRNLITHSSGLFSLDKNQLNTASNGRYDLWRTGLDIFKENPIFGIGPRGYRYVYKDYASPSDFWMKKYGQTQTHPHLFLIEIMCETGVFGLILFLIVNSRFIAYYSKDPDPWILSSILAFFPFNLHLAFYGSYWSSLLWFLVGIGLGRLYSDKK